MPGARVNLATERSNCNCTRDLQRKLPESLLTRYHRWLFESGTTGSVETLQPRNGWPRRQNSKLAVAAETAHGLLTRPARFWQCCAAFSTCAEATDVLHALVTSKLLAGDGSHNAAFVHVEDKTACGHVRLSLAWSWASPDVGKQRSGTACVSAVSAQITLGASAQLRSRPRDTGGCSRHHHRLLHTNDQSSRQATGVTPSAATQQRQAS